LEAREVEEMESLLFSIYILHTLLSIYLSLHFEGGFMAEFVKLWENVRGIEFAPIRFEVSDDLSRWSAEIPGKVVAKAEALSGPMTPPGKRVQTIIHLVVKEDPVLLQHGERL
jgi:hypothetical protein